ncbi:catechol 2,3-dioxygenase [Pseudomonas taiwanensis]|uniref:catechol 2,3-dioxygenase n=1 Tax=Pseudomonas TaxID=286 RepID=UPI0015BD89D8|nr:MULTISPECIES: catechol 2,3-dioxygenase [Pseudomonas]MDH4564398.1 catechol 2,3-dioxygenase [Pseudomonas sp. BN411]MDH4653760.1 catechol 2,3-dioxygenase [Pseudomonas sp. BN606]MDH4874082.1 catechol 2,3-dioxygenase [Pseudomonas sp. BN515]NWL75714.1 catechol 2,3-dioxygenase [Pseudomonas taiwanensis]
MAMTGVLRPGHVQLRVMDLEAGVHHYRDVLGMLETGRDSQGRIYLKCRDEFDHHSVILREADRAGMDFVGFKVLNVATLNDLEGKLQAYGVDTHRIAAGDLLETGERVRFTTPSGHEVELYAEKTFVGNGCGEVNPTPWDPTATHGISPLRMDHLLLYGPNVPETLKLFIDVLGFTLVERVLGPDGETNIIGFLSCSIKSHDIAFGHYEEPGKLHHVSFLMESWEQVLRAGDIMAMNNVPVDIGPTRHGVTRGRTIYAWDPSGNRFETFKEDRQPYPDHPPLTWTFDGIGDGGGLDYVQRKLHETFLTVVT